MTLKIGLIGIIGGELKEDPDGTLQEVGRVGYDGIEGGVGIASRAGLSVGELKARLEALGLESVANGGVLLPGDDEKADSAVQGALMLGARYVVSYWGPCEERDEVLGLAEFLDGFGARCRAEGLRFCYHNHNHEFARFGDERGLDVLMANTDPANVALELDVAWATYGGCDPGEIIRRYAGRCPLLHVKDLAEVPEGGQTGNEGRRETQFTEVGTGLVDVEGAVEAARECGVEWLVVEQDRMRDLEPMESIRVSYANLRALIR